MAFIKHSLLVLTAGLLLAPAAARAEKIDYETQILPLLEDNCYDCHDADKQKGDLRLDSRPLLL